MGITTMSLIFISMFNKKRVLSICFSKPFDMKAKYFYRVLSH